MRNLAGHTYHYFKGFIGPSISEREVLNAINLSGSTADQIFEVIESRSLRHVPLNFRCWYRAKVDEILTHLTFQQKTRVNNPLEPEALQRRIDLDNNFSHEACYELTAKGTTTPADRQSKAQNHEPIAIEVTPR